MTNKQVRFKHYITGGKLKETDLEVVTTNIVESWRMSGRMQGFARIKNLYLCCDSSMRSRMKSDGHLPFAPGDVLTSYGVGKIIESGNPNFRSGDYVWGITSWEEYSTHEFAYQLAKINYPEVPLSYYTSILGMPGLTAYSGLYKICSAKKGEYVYISNASSVIGQLAGQFAKLMGCYVVGSTVFNQKVDLLKTTLGFNDAFNYKKEPDLSAALKRYFPQGIDIFFETTNGFGLDVVLVNMREKGRIALSEPISDNGHDLGMLYPKLLRIKGFSGVDHIDIYRDYEDFVVPLIKENKIICPQEEAEGIENAPAALVHALSSENSDNQVVVVVAREQAGE